MNTAAKKVDSAGQVDSARGAAAAAETGGLAIVAKATLGRLLASVGRTIERRQTLPILSNVHLECAAGEIRAIGTDMEIETAAEVPATSGSDFAPITVSHAQIKQILAGVPAGPVGIGPADDDRMCLRAAGVDYHLPTLPAADFPLRAIGATARFEVPADELASAISAIAHAMAEQEVRYYLNGMLFELHSGGMLRLVATDAHRLALAEMESSDVGSVHFDTDSTPRQWIFPRRGIVTLQRLLAGVEGSVTVRVGDDFARFDAGNWQHSVKIVDGKYPDFNRVIPKHGGVSATFDNAAAQGLIKPLLAVAHPKYRGLKLTVRTGEVEIEAVGRDGESATGRLAAEVTGAQDGGFKIGFNGAYLLEHLKNNPPGLVRYSMSASDSSVLVTCAADEAAGRRRLAVIMSMRLD